MSIEPAFVALRATYLPAYKAAVIYMPISHLSSACPVRVSFTLMGSSALYICRGLSTNQLFYAKQTQFPKGQNERKFTNNNELSNLYPAGGAKKQTQFKPGHAHRT